MAFTRCTDSFAFSCQGHRIYREGSCVLIEALTNAFELDRSAARGEMAGARTLALEHKPALGNAPRIESLRLSKLDRKESVIPRLLRTTH